MVLPQGDDETDLVVFPEEALTSLRSRWEMRWEEGESRGEERRNWD